MDLLAVLALLAFIVGAVIAFVKREFALGFVAAGLAILALADAGLKIGS